MKNSIALAAAAIVAALALFSAPAPAAAQTTCEAPNPKHLQGREVIWTGTVTAEVIEPAPGLIIAHGYSSGATSYGDLSNRTFSVPSGNWPIDSISVGAYTTNNGRLAFSLFGSTTDPTDLSPLEISSFRLHLCDQKYDFSDAMTSDEDHAYNWNAGLDWSGVTTRTLRISAPRLDRRALSMYSNNPGDGWVGLRWTGRPVNRWTSVDKYEYRYSAGETVPSSERWIVVPDSRDRGTSLGDEHDVTVAGLQNGTKYAFEIRAVFFAGGTTLTRKTTATPVAPVQASPEITGNAIWQGTTIRIPYDRPLTRASSLQPISGGAFIFTVSDVPARFACGGSNNTPGTNCIAKPAAPTVSSVVMSGSHIVLNVSGEYPYQRIARGGWQPGFSVRMLSSKIIYGVDGTRTNSLCEKALDDGSLINHDRLLGCFWNRGQRRFTGRGLPVYWQRGETPGSFSEETTIEGDSDGTIGVPVVPETPLIPAFSRVPREHDGASKFSVRFHLSEEPDGLSFRTVHNGLFDVTGGEIVKAKRLKRGKNNGWQLDIVPAGLGDVTLQVRATTACDVAPGVCTADGRMLTERLLADIPGPVTLSVADATVQEAAGARLEFVVTLRRDCRRRAARAARRSRNR